MKATTNLEAAAVDVESAPSRTPRAWAIAYLWSNHAYLAVWTDGAMYGAFLRAIAETFLEGK